jgi:hypothetical protein
MRKAVAVGAIIPGTAGCLPFLGAPEGVSETTVRGRPERVRAIVADAFRAHGHLGRAIVVDRARIRPRSGPGSCSCPMVMPTLHSSCRLRREIADEILATAIGSTGRKVIADGNPRER